jgi:hypothetical protein
MNILVLSIRVIQRESKVAERLEEKE